ncbi:MAG: inorganic diphosphatase, partial [Pseudomonadota bacterium]|nr:inorganic diphosphatase [Pseudomonadota bacterium]
KILAVPVGDPRFDDILTLDDLRSHWLKEIENFFATYKLLEDKETELHGWEDTEVALREIEIAKKRYREVIQKGTAT